jgi:hypothetical protein
MKKRMIVMVSLLLIVALLPLTLSTAYADRSTTGWCGSGLRWSLDTSTGTLTITGDGEMRDYPNWGSIQSSVTKIVIGNEVTSIGAYEFSRFSKLTDVTIGSSVVSIGECAFNTCTELTRVNLPNSLKTISDLAFYSCEKLRSVTIPGSVESIGECAFSYNEALTSLEIKSGVKSIGENAFYACTGLKSVTVPNSVTYLGKGSFAYCSALESVTIGNGVTSIFWNTFGNCESLSSITLGSSVTSIYGHVFEDAAWWSAQPDGLVYLGDILLGHKGDCSGSLTVKNGTRVIADEAVYDCAELTAVTLPETLEIIGERAFYGCEGLSEIMLPNSLTTIGSAAFSNCTNLEFIGLKNNITAVGADAFSDTAWWDSLSDGLICANGIMMGYKNTCPTNVEVASGTRVIADKAFAGCNNLVSATIPDSVVTLGEKAFMNCSGLKNVTVGSGVTFIPESVFDSCGELLNVELRGSVTTLGDYAFYRCYELKSVSMGNKVETIGRGAFYLCTNLESIQLSNTLKTIGVSAFAECTSLETLTVPGSVSKMGLCAFLNCSNLTSLTLQNGLTEIGPEAFSNCTGLTAVVIPDTVTAIRNDAFSGCTGLETVTIGDSVKNIDDAAFQDCAGIESITLPCSAYINSSSAFDGCEAVREVRLTKGTGRMADYSMDLGDGWTTIWSGNTPWYESTCETITVELDEGIEYIGRDAFLGCKGLTKIVIPDGVKEIPYEAFCESGLQEIWLPGSLEMIGMRAFADCAVTVVHYKGTKAMMDHKLSLDWDSNYPLGDAMWYVQLDTITNGKVIWNAEDVKFKGSTPYVIANGSAQTPRFTVLDDMGYEVDPEDYTYEYRENTAAGTGYVFITFRTFCSGSCRGSFKIYLQPTTTTTVANANDGIKLTWSKVNGADGYVIYRRAWSSTTNGWTDFVRWNNTTALNWTDTKVYAGTRYQYGIKAYFNRRLDPVSGTYIGGNTGDNFNLGEVGPLKTTVRITTRTLNSVTAGTKQMTVKWGASGLFTGYQIQYATNSAFTQNAKAIKITNPKTASTVIKSLTSGKTYYVRLRSYHVFNGVTYFGEWSNVKNCKVK